MKKNLKKPVILVVICCFVLYLFINYVLPPNLHGKWYLYTGSDINTEKNISEKLNSKDYIEITTRHTTH